MIVLQDISYVLPDQEVLFSNINLTINRSDKVQIIGNNGSGKSTLLKIISGQLLSSGGQIMVARSPYLIPQIFGQYNHLTIHQALKVEAKINSLKEILAGEATITNLEILGDDWLVEERCGEALSYWGLESLDLNQFVGSLSGGQKTKLFLAGIRLHQPELILMDEPSNHLDASARHLLMNLSNRRKVHWWL